MSHMPICLLQSAEMKTDFMAIDSSSKVFYPVYRSGDDVVVKVGRFRQSVTHGYLDELINSLTCVVLLKGC